MSKIIHKPSTSIHGTYFDSNKDKTEVEPCATVTQSQAYLALDGDESDQEGFQNIRSDESILHDPARWGAVEVRYVNNGESQPRATSCVLPQDDANNLQQQTIIVEKVVITNLLNTPRQVYGRQGTSRMSEYIDYDLKDSSNQMESDSEYTSIYTTEIEKCSRDDETLPAEIDRKYSQEQTNDISSTHDNTEIELQQSEGDQVVSGYTRSSGEDDVAGLSNHTLSSCFQSFQTAPDVLTEQTIDEYRRIALSILLQRKKEEMEKQGKETHHNLGSGSSQSTRDDVALGSHKQSPLFQVEQLHIRDNLPPKQSTRISRVQEQIDRHRNRMVKANQESLKGFEKKLMKDKEVQRNRNVSPGLIKSRQSLLHFGQTEKATTNEKQAHDKEAQEDDTTQSTNTGLNQMATCINRELKPGCYLEINDLHHSNSNDTILSNSDEMLESSCTDIPLIQNILRSPTAKAVQALCLFSQGIERGDSVRKSLVNDHSISVGEILEQYQKLFDCVSSGSCSSCEATDESPQAGAWTQLSKSKENSVQFNKSATGKMRMSGSAPSHQSQPVLENEACSGTGSLKNITTRQNLESPKCKSQSLSPVSRAKNAIHLSIPHILNKGTPQDLPLTQGFLDEPPKSFDELQNDEKYVTYDNNDSKSFNRCRSFEGYNNYKQVNSPSIQRRNSYSYIHMKRFREYKQHPEKNVQYKNNRDVNKKGKEIILTTHKLTNDKPIRVLDHGKRLVQREDRFRSSERVQKHNCITKQDYTEIASNSQRGTVKHINNIKSNSKRTGFRGGTQLHKGNDKTIGLHTNTTGERTLVSPSGYKERGDLKVLGNRDLDVDESSNLNPYDSLIRDNTKTRTISLSSFNPMLESFSYMSGTDVTMPMSTCQWPSTTDKTSAESLCAHFESEKSEELGAHKSRSNISINESERHDSIRHINSKTLVNLEFDLKGLCSQSSLGTNEDSSANLDLAQSDTSSNRSECSCTGIPLTNEACSKLPVIKVEQEKDAFGVKLSTEEEANVKKPKRGMIPKGRLIKKINSGEVGEDINVTKAVCKHKKTKTVANTEDDTFVGSRKKVNVFKNAKTFHKSIENTNGFEKDDNLKTVCLKPGENERGVWCKVKDHGIIPEQGCSAINPRDNAVCVDSINDLSEENSITHPRGSKPVLGGEPCSHNFESYSVFDRTKCCIVEKWNHLKTHHETTSLAWNPDQTSEWVETTTSFADSLSQVKVGENAKHSKLVQNSILGMSGDERNDSLQTEMRISSEVMNNDCGELIETGLEAPSVETKREPPDSHETPCSSRQNMSTDENACIAETVCIRVSSGNVIHSEIDDGSIHSFKGKMDRSYNLCFEDPVAKTTSISDRTTGKRYEQIQDDEIQEQENMNVQHEDRLIPSPLQHIAVNFSFPWYFLQPGTSRSAKRWTPINPRMLWRNGLITIVNTDIFSLCSNDHPSRRITNVPVSSTPAGGLDRIEGHVTFVKNTNGFEHEQLGCSFYETNEHNFHDDKSMDWMHNDNIIRYDTDSSTFEASKVTCPGGNLINIEEEENGNRSTVHDDDISDREDEWCHKAFQNMKISDLIGFHQDVPMLTTTSYNSVQKQNVLQYPEEITPTDKATDSKRSGVKIIELPTVFISLDEPVEGPIENSITKSTLRSPTKKCVANMASEVSSEDESLPKTTGIQTTDSEIGDSIKDSVKHVELSTAMSYGTYQEHESLQLTDAYIQNKEYTGKSLIIEIIPPPSEFSNLESHGLDKNWDDRNLKKTECDSDDPILQVSLKKCSNDFNDDGGKYTLNTDTHDQVELSIKEPKEKCRNARGHQEIANHGTKECNSGLSPNCSTMLRMCTDDFNRASNSHHSSLDDKQGGDHINIGVDDGDCHREKRSTNSSERTDTESNEPYKNHICSAISFPGSSILCLSFTELQRCREMLSSSPDSPATQNAPATSISSHQFDTDNTLSCQEIEKDISPDMPELDIDKNVSSEISDHKVDEDMSPGALDFMCSATCEMNSHDCSFMDRPSNQSMDGMNRRDRSKKNAGCLETVLSSPCQCYTHRGSKNDSLSRPETSMHQTISCSCLIQSREDSKDYDSPSISRDRTFLYKRSGIQRLAQSIADTKVRQFIDTLTSRFVSAMVAILHQEVRDCSLGESSVSCKENPHESSEWLSFCSESQNGSETQCDEISMGTTVSLVAEDTSTHHITIDRKWEKTRSYFEKIHDAFERQSATHGRSISDHETYNDYKKTSIDCYRTFDNDYPLASPQDATLPSKRDGVKMLNNAIADGALHQQSISDDGSSRESQKVKPSVRKQCTSSIVSTGNIKLNAGKNTSFKLESVECEASKLLDHTANVQVKYKTTLDEEGKRKLEMIAQRKRLIENVIHTYLNRLRKLCDSTVSQKCQIKSCRGYYFSEESPPPPKKDICGNYLTTSLRKNTTFNFTTSYSSRSGPTIAKTMSHMTYFREDTDMHQMYTKRIEDEPGFIALSPPESVYKYHHFAKNKSIEEFNHSSHSRDNRDSFCRKRFKATKQPLCGFSFKGNLVSQNIPNTQGAEIGENGKEELISILRSGADGLKKLNKVHNEHELDTFDELGSFKTEMHSAPSIYTQESKGKAMSIETSIDLGTTCMNNKHEGNSKMKRRHCSFCNGVMVNPNKIVLQISPKPDCAMCTDKSTQANPHCERVCPHIHNPLTFTDEVTENNMSRHDSFSTVGAKRLSSEIKGTVQYITSITLLKFMCDLLCSHKTIKQMDVTQSPVTTSIEDSTSFAVQHEPISPAKYEIDAFETIVIPGEQDSTEVTSLYERQYEHCLPTGYRKNPTHENSQSSQLKVMQKYVSSNHLCGGHVWNDTSTESLELWNKMRSVRASSVEQGSLCRDDTRVTDDISWMCQPHETTKFVSLLILGTPCLINTVRYNYPERRGMNLLSHHFQKEPITISEECFSADPTHEICAAYLESENVHKTPSFNPLSEFILDPDQAQFPSDIEISKVGSLICRRNELCSRSIMGPEKMTVMPQTVGNNSTQSSLESDNGNVESLLSGDPKIVRVEINSDDSMSKSSSECSKYQVLESSKDAKNVNADPMKVLCCDHEERQQKDEPDVYIKRLKDILFDMHSKFDTFLQGNKPSSFCRTHSSSGVIDSCRNNRCPQQTGFAVKRMDKTNVEVGRVHCSSDSSFNLTTNPWSNASSTTNIETQLNDKNSFDNDIRRESVDIPMQKSKPEYQDIGHIHPIKKREEKYGNTSKQGIGSYDPKQYNSDSMVYRSSLFRVVLQSEIHPDTVCRSLTNIQSAKDDSLVLHIHDRKVCNNDNESLDSCHPGHRKLPGVETFDKTHDILSVFGNVSNSEGFDRSPVKGVPMGLDQEVQNVSEGFVKIPNFEDSTTTSTELPPGEAVDSQLPTVGEKTGDKLIPEPGNHKLIKITNKSECFDEGYLKLNFRTVCGDESIFSDDNDIIKQVECWKKQFSMKQLRASGKDDTFLKKDNNENNEHVMTHNPYAHVGSLSTCPRFSPTKSSENTNDLQVDLLSQIPSHDLLSQHCSQVNKCSPENKTKSTPSYRMEPVLSECGFVEFNALGSKNLPSSQDNRPSYTCYRGNISMMGFKRPQLNELRRIEAPCPKKGGVISKTTRNESDDGTGGIPGAKQPSPGRSLLPRNHFQKDAPCFSIKMNVSPTGILETTDAKENARRVYTRGYLVEPSTSLSSITNNDDGLHQGSEGCMSNQDHYVKCNKGNRKVNSQNITLDKVEQNYQDFRKITIDSIREKPNVPVDNTSQKDGSFNNRPPVSPTESPRSGFFHRHSDFQKCMPTLTNRGTHLLKHTVDSHKNTSGSEKSSPRAEGDLCQGHRFHIDESSPAKEIPDLKERNLAHKDINVYTYQSNNLNSISETALVDPTQNDNGSHLYDPEATILYSGEKRKNVFNNDTMSLDVKVKSSATSIESLLHTKYVSLSDRGNIGKRYQSDGLGQTSCSTTSRLHNVTPRVYNVQNNATSPYKKKQLLNNENHLSNTFLSANNTQECHSQFCQEGVLFKDVIEATSAVDQRKLAPSSRANGFSVSDNYDTQPYNITGQMKRRMLKPPSLQDANTSRGIFKPLKSSLPTKNKKTTCTSESMSRQTPTSTNTVEVRPGLPHQIVEEFKKSRARPSKIPIDVYNIYSRRNNDPPNGANSKAKKKARKTKNESSNILRSVVISGPVMNTAFPLQRHGIEDDDVEGCGISYQANHGGQHICDEMNKNGQQPSCEQHKRPNCVAAKECKHVEDSKDPPYLAATTTAVAASATRTKCTPPNGNGVIDEVCKHGWKNAIKKFVPFGKKKTRDLGAT